MTDLERIQIARAEEQAQAITSADFREPCGKRPIPGTKIPLTRPAHCRACDAPATHGSYCQKHYNRIAKGLAYDDDLWPTWADARRAAKGNPRFGGRREFSRRAAQHRVRLVRTLAGER